MNKTQSTFIFVLSFIVLSLLLGSCSSHKKSGPAVPDADWTFSPQAIEVSYQADKNLNLYDEKPHTILICLYQLSDPNVYNDLSTSRDGLNKLLECSRFDQSALGFKKIIVQPGESKNIVLDRAEKAQWVGLVAGYYTLDPDMVTHLYQIPVVSKRNWLLMKKTMPGKLSINLTLSPSKIDQGGSQ